MAIKILIVNAPLFNQNTNEAYGKLEVKEVEDYVSAGWQLTSITPVVPNQPGGGGGISAIQYLIKLDK